MAGFICVLGIAAPSTLANITETEHLNTEIPVGWIQTVNSANLNLRVNEYLPAESPDPWRQKLSIEALSSNPLPDPIEFVNGWAEQQSQLCYQFDGHPIYSGLENGYPTVVHMLICGKNKQTQKPIVTMIKVIRGNQALYTVTRIWRLETLPLDEAEIAAWSASLGNTSVCDPTLPAHPC